MGVLLAPALTAAVYALFVLGHGALCVADAPDSTTCSWGYWVARLPWWPFGRTEPLGWMSGWLVRDVAGLAVGPAFWGPALWTGLVVLSTAYRAPREGPRERANSTTGALATAVGIGLPALLLIDGRLHGPTTVALPFPIRLESVVGRDGIDWVGGLAFLLLLGSARPWGRIYCARICPIGALSAALAPFGPALSGRGPRIGGASLGGALIAALGTALCVRVLIDGTSFSETVHFHRVVIGFFGMGLVGVASVPFFGSRIWCRRLCPVGALLTWAGGNRGRLLRTKACTDCDSCSRACSMGVELHALPVGRAASLRTVHCVQCGACVDACSEGAVELVSLPRRSA